MARVPMIKVCLPLFRDWTKAFVGCKVMGAHLVCLFGSIYEIMGAHCHLI
jgi:hypothetical protein